MLDNQKLYQRLGEFFPFQVIYFNKNLDILEILYDSKTASLRESKNLSEIIELSDLKEFKKLLEEVDNTSKPVRRHVPILPKNSDILKWHEVEISKESDGNYLWLGLDVDRMKRRVDKYKKEVNILRKIAFKDPLTGLLNRRGLELSVKELLKDEEGYIDVLYIDMDNLKEANDTKGHEYGDTQIKAVAEAIKGSIRETDIATRVGGDEMVIISKRELESTFTPQTLAKRILEKVNNSKDLEVTVSIGIATAEVQDLDWEKLIKLADEKNREAKKAGKNRAI
jgi:diguanylate cyclase (GGDEF)-like protein